VAHFTIPTYKGISEEAREEEKGVRVKEKLLEYYQHKEE